MVAETISTTTPVNDNKSVIIIVGSVIGLTIVAGLVAGIICWKRKQTQFLSKGKRKIIC